jgi:hypothetical protein
MNDIQSIRAEAVNSAKLAVEFDDKENVEEACKHYIKAAEKLKYLSQIDENVYNKDTYRKKAMEYCERAGKLKSMLKDSEEKKQPVISGGGGK